MSKMSEVFRLVKSRAEIIFFWPWITTMACLLVGRGFPPLYPSFMAILASALITTSVYIYNDSVDSEMDKVNPRKAKRPLVDGSATLETARQLVAVSGTLGLLVSYLVHPAMFLATLAYFIVYFIYSMPGVRLKDMFVVKELVSVSAFVFGSLIASTAITGGVHVSTLIVGFVLAVFGFLSTPAVNESFDAKEDQTSGIRTLGVALSWQGRVQMLGAAIFYIIAATLAAATWLGFSYVLPIAVTLGGVVVLMNLPGIYREFEDRKVMRMRRVMKVYLFFTQIMFVVAVTDFAHSLL